MTEPLPQQLRRSSTQRSLKFFHGLPQNSALERVARARGSACRARSASPLYDAGGTVMPCFAWFLAAIRDAADGSIGLGLSLAKTCTQRSNVAQFRGAPD
jgi:hypothetical protein